MACVKTRLANKLRSLRGETPLNQIQLATGIGRRLLKCYEDGEKLPGDTNLKKLCQYYETSFASLKELQLEDLYPEGSENREIVIQWIQKLLQQYSIRD